MVAGAFSLLWKICNLLRLWREHIFNKLYILFLDFKWIIKSGTNYVLDLTGWTSIFYLFSIHITIWIYLTLCIYPHISLQFFYSHLYMSSTYTHSSLYVVHLNQWIASRWRDMVTMSSTYLPSYLCHLSALPTFIYLHMLSHLPNPTDLCLPGRKGRWGSRRK